MKFFRKQGIEPETVVQHSSELCIPKHLACHNDLVPFSDLMKWLKEVDQTVFRELCEVCDSVIVTGHGLLHQCTNTWNLIRCTVQIPQLSEIHVTHH